VASVTTTAGTPGGSAAAPLVLAADTTVALANEMLAKPVDAADAVTMLRALRDRDHRVMTGLALARGDAVLWSTVFSTTVRMRPYGDDEIERYVASSQPLDKAGAYGIQDGSFRPVARIDGCYTNVVGLPLCEVRLALATVAPEQTWGAPGTDMLCETLRAEAGVPGNPACTIP
jgi:MAF protein